MNSRFSADLIAHKVKACQEFEVIDTIKVGQESWQNELLMFIKPELLISDDADSVSTRLSMIFDKLNDFGAQVEGMVIVTGKVLEKFGVMDRHYGYINQLSRFASSTLDDHDREQIGDALGIDINSYRILGGHEFLNAFPTENAFSLDTLWFTKKSIKLRSGFYIQAYDYAGKNIVLVNGFHPSQLFHFTNPDHKLLLMLIHSNTDWKTLRNSMIGSTFPEKAEPQSIRGTLFHKSDQYGLKEVSIAYNGVHLSAGPFEAFFEISNFFGNILGLDIKLEQPLILKKMAKRDSVENSIKVLQNPVLIQSPKSIDLFTMTEDLDTEQSINIWLDKKSL